MSNNNDFSHRKSTKKSNNSVERKKIDRRKSTSSSKTRTTNYDTKNSTNKKPIPERTKKPTSKPIEKPKKKRRYLNPTFSNAIFFLFIVFALYGINMFFSLFNNSNIDSMVLKSIDITKNDAYNGIIIRDETLYKASEDGYLSIVANEFDKVSKGTLIFSISKDTDTTLEDQLSNVEDELFNLQTFREEYSNYRTEIDEIQTNVEKSIDNFSNSNYDNINNLTDDINKSLDLRKQIVFADQRIADTTTIDTKQLIESKIDDNSTKTYATDGGIIAYQYDGLEETISVDKMLELTLEQTKMSSTYDVHDEVSTINDDDIMRVVESNIWYVGTYINEKDAANLTVGQNKNLFFEVDGNFQEIAAQVNHISESVDKNTYVIFEIRAYMQQFINERSVNVALKSETYMNMKIPTTSLVYKEYLKIPINYARTTDQTVVIKKSDDATPMTVPINIESTDNTNAYYLIDKSTTDLLVGSELVNPDNAEDTYLIPEVVRSAGVYKINNGIANFVNVEINENLDETYNNDEFVYILPSQSLKEYDRILINSSDAVEGAIIQ